MVQTRSPFPEHQIDVVWFRLETHQNHLLFRLYINFGRASTGASSKTDERYQHLLILKKERNINVAP